MTATSNNVNIIIVILGSDTAMPIPKESMAKAIPNKIASFVSIIPEISKSTFEGSLKIFMAIPKDPILMTAIEVGWEIFSLGNLLFNQPWIKNQTPIKNKITAPIMFIISRSYFGQRFQQRNPLSMGQWKCSQIIRNVKGL